nr:MAG TPA: hypothetical protein [Caudoviricetes sp.]
MYTKSVLTLSSSATCFTVSSSSNRPTAFRHRDHKRQHNAWVWQFVPVADAVYIRKIVTQHARVTD